jgi:hypothetical protein
VQLETNEKQIMEGMKMGIISKDELKKALTKEDWQKPPVDISLKYIMDSKTLKTGLPMK